MIRFPLIRAAFAALSIIATFTACTPPVPEGRFACTTNADCPGSFVCAADSLCRSTAIDANVDTGTTDAGETDAGKCLAGFAEVGPVCIDIDECASTTSPCAPTQVCTNSSGSYSCACPVGQIMGTTACVPNVDECAMNTDDCGAHASCTNTADAFTCTCNTDYVGDGHTCTLDLCDLSADTDTGTVSIVVTHLGLPDAEGFDLDDLNNASVPGGVGSNVAGCGRIDITGGIDNALANLAGQLEGTFEIEAGYQGALTVGTSVITLTLTHVAPANPANDACIGASLLVHRTGVSDQVTVGRGRLVDNVALVRFDDTFSLEVLTDLPDASCNNSMCNPGILVTTFSGGRGRFSLNASHTDLMAGSLLGGFLFFSDADGAYATANATGLQAALNTWGTQVNLSSAIQTNFVQAFSSARDLHMLVDGSIDYCSGPDVSMLDKNAISAALSLDSL